MGCPEQSEVQKFLQKDASGAPSRCRLTEGDLSSVQNLCWLMIVWDYTTRTQYIDVHWGL